MEVNKLCELRKTGMEEILCRFFMKRIIFLQK